MPDYYTDEEIQAGIDFGIENAKAINYGIKTETISPEAIGANGVTAILDTNIAKNPIADAASGGKIGDVVGKNNSNNHGYDSPGDVPTVPNAIPEVDVTALPEPLAELGFGGKVGKFLGDNQKGIGAAIGAVGAISSMVSQQKSLDKGIDSAKDAIGEMGKAKNNISEQNRSYVSDIRGDFSEGNQLQALSSMDDLKKSLASVDQGNLSGGQIKHKADTEIAGVNKKLSALYDSQKKKAEMNIEKTMDDARQSQDRLTDNIDSTRKEIKKMKEAKKNATRNALVDVAKVGANFIPGVGPLASMAMGTALDQFKKTNEYG